MAVGGGTRDHPSMYEAGCLEAVGKLLVLRLAQPLIAFMQEDCDAAAAAAARQQPRYG
jgi:hypothetical protein